MAWRTMPLDSACPNSDSMERRSAMSKLPTGSTTVTASVRCQLAVDWPSTTSSGAGNAFSRNAK
eukprot:15466813-Alexandrium_andersonii.AAC.1